MTKDRRDTMTKPPQLKYLKLSRIQERPGPNPNAMDDAQYALLINAVKKLGFIQPVTVRTSTDGYVLIDGHHRFRAAKAAGLAQIPALVADHLSDPEAAASMLSLNRLRGETDLAKAGKVLQELAELGFDDLTLTGFSGGDIDLLLRNVGTLQDADDLGADAGAGTLRPAEEAINNQQRFALRLLFDRADDRDKIKALGLSHGPTVEAGLLALMDEQSAHPEKEVS